MHSHPKTSTMNLHRLVAGAAMFGIALSGLHAQKIADTVVKKDGSRERGVEVTAFTLTGIKTKKGAEEREIPPHQVADIEWSDLPETFVSGRTAMARGDFDSARQLFGEAANQATRPVLKTEAKFLQCRAAVASAATSKQAAADAAGATRAWLGESADNWRVPEGMLLLGRALRLAGTGADAETALKELDDRASRDGWSPVWAARAKFELALAQVDQNKGGDARSSFQSASSAADLALGTPSGDDAELKQIKIQGRVGEGETFLAEKDFGRAAEFFRGLANSGQAELVAAGRAGEGEARYQMAVASKNLDEFRAAQVALAQASVLDQTSGEASAKANYYLGMCLLALAARDDDSSKARANAYFTLVTKAYPTSRWAAAAKAELAKG